MNADDLPLPLGPSNDYAMDPDKAVAIREALFVLALAAEEETWCENRWSVDQSAESCQAAWDALQSAATARREAVLALRKVRAS